MLVVVHQDSQTMTNTSVQCAESNATFVEMQPLKLEQPEDPCEERERSFSHRSFVQGEDDSCDTL